MKARSISKIIGHELSSALLVCISIIVSMVNISSTFGDEIMDNFSNIGYRPVSDTCPIVVQEGHAYRQAGKHNDNFLYKEWCEETFVNGNYIYDAYKDIAFSIEYTPEVSETDFWQTPVETTRLKKGDCEDAVFLFFSQLPADQKNAEIVWGWIINKRSTIGRAHVWYQLVDKKGQQYVVEGFSKDWNGIIPMEIIEETESRIPILTMPHTAVIRLTDSQPETGDSQITHTFSYLLPLTNFSNHDSGNQPFSQGMDNALLPNTTREISNILSKLHELFSRYERQKEEANMQVSYKGNSSPPEHSRAGDRILAGMKKFYPEKNLICKR
jgi:hypothetical protein